MNTIEKLKLTTEQEKVLNEFCMAYSKMIENGVYLAFCPGYGLYAYNAKNVNCFDAPENAAYDNDKEPLTITDLELVTRNNPLICELDKPETLVVFDEE